MPDPRPEVGQNTPRQIARDISYARSAETRVGRSVIQLLENATGRPGLIRRADGYADDVARGADFWEVMAARYGLGLSVSGDIADIPATGPVIIVANHPFGILDGLMMGLILSRRRGEFRILANHVFRKAEDLHRVILPISFDGDKAAQRQNIETRAAALAHLNAGGALGVFPGGTVSTSATLFSRPLDPHWRSFTGRLIAKSGAAVVPIHFDGQNSRLFQIASHLHPTLRLGLLIREFRRRVDKPVRVAIGTPIDPADIAACNDDAKAVMDFLRKATYDLSPTPVDSDQTGYDFEAPRKG